MIYNYTKLKEKIDSIFGDYKAFAEAMNLSPQIIKQKLAGSYNFTQNQIVRASGLLGFSIEEIPAYFFTEYYQKEEETTSELQYITVPIERYKEFVDSDIKLKFMRIYLDNLVGYVKGERSEK